MATVKAETTVELESRWTIEQVAEFLGVSPKSVRRWSEAGRMPPGKKLPGRAIRWDPDKIRRWWEKLPAS